MNIYRQKGFETDNIKYTKKELREMSANSKKV